MSTYIVHIEQKRNSTEESDCDCECKSELKYHKPRRIIHRRLQKSNRSQSPCFYADDESQTISRASSITENDGNEKCNKFLNLSSSTHKPITKQYKRQRIIKKRQAPEDLICIEYKTIDLLIGSLLTIFIWYFAYHFNGRAFFHFITSAIILFIFTLFKYRHQIHEKKFWQCLISNCGLLFQAYCTMFALCVLFCIANSYVFKNLNIYITIGLAIMIGIYVRLRINNYYFEKRVNEMF